MMDFIEFPKIARFSRDCIVTEKIDGTNAQIYIGPNGEFLTGSRNKWITPENDNYGFSAWAHKNKQELLKLGEGKHYGEWWGQGIQRKYGMTEKVFSLFDVSRWKENRPFCCDVVPVLWEGNFLNLDIKAVMNALQEFGSIAARRYGREFMNPEGVVIFHVAANVSFKKTFLKDETGKWEK